MCCLTCIMSDIDVCVWVPMRVSKFLKRTTRNTQNIASWSIITMLVCLCVYILDKIKTRLHHINRSKKHWVHGLKRTCPIQRTESISFVMSIQMLTIVCFSAALHVRLFQGRRIAHMSLNCLQSLANIAVTAAWIRWVSTKSSGWSLILTRTVCAKHTFLE